MVVQEYEIALNDGARLGRPAPKRRVGHLDECCANCWGLKTPRWPSVPESARISFFIEILHRFSKGTPKLSCIVNKIHSRNTRWKSQGSHKLLETQDKRMSLKLPL